MSLLLLTLDVDECHEQNYDCRPVGIASCVNTPGTYRCACKDGYQNQNQNLCVGRYTQISAYHVVRLKELEFSGVFCSTVGKLRLHSLGICKLQQCCGYRAAIVIVTILVVVAIIISTTIILPLKFCYQHCHLY